MANEDSVAKKIQEKRTRVQKAQELHQRNTKERKDKIQEVRALYIQNKDNPVLLDILEKARSFSNYHIKIAQDGVGARKTGFKLEDGSAEVENIFLTNNKRVSELDKSAGILELVDYIERQLRDLPTKEVDVEEPAEENPEVDEEQ